MNLQRGTANKINNKKNPTKNGIASENCMWAHTSSGCESTTFWQMLCSCATSLTRPKSCSWMICRAVLPDDLHISRNTWEPGETRRTQVRTRMQTSTSWGVCTEWQIEGDNCMVGAADWPAWQPKRRYVPFPGAPAAQPVQKERSGWNERVT